MLFPKRVKHRRVQKKRRNPRVLMRKTRSWSNKTSEVIYGSHGLKATSYARLTSKQIEAARRVISRTVGKYGKYWIRVFPDMPFTRKADGVGMGKGKGAPAGFCREVFIGEVMFEVGGVKDDVARLALEKAAKKLPLTAKVVERDYIC